MGGGVPKPEPQGAATRCSRNDGKPRIPLRISPPRHGPSRDGTVLHQWRFAVVEKRWHASWEAEGGGGSEGDGWGARATGPWQLPADHEVAAAFTKRRQRYLQELDYYNEFGRTTSSFDRWHGHFFLCKLQRRQAKPMHGLLSSRSRYMVHSTFCLW
ncbi:unnamed protein product [Urochloa humidicola]